MMATRKAPSGPRHAFCNRHEPYEPAPAGWLCFMDKRTSDDDILARMILVDELAEIAARHHAAWLASLTVEASGIGLGIVGKADTAVWAKAPTPTAYAADLGDAAEAVSIADYAAVAA